MPTQNLCFLSLILNVAFLTRTTFCQINWKAGAGGVQWASACDFNNQDLSSALVSSEQCGNTCISKSGCTHFSWTNYQGGTCWMKKGTVQKSDAISNGNTGMICGILASSGLNGKREWVVCNGLQHVISIIKT